MPTMAPRTPPPAEIEARTPKARAVQAGGKMRVAIERVRTSRLLRASRWTSMRTECTVERGETKCQRWTACGGLGAAHRNKRPNAVTMARVAA